MNWIAWFNISTAGLLRTFRRAASKRIYIGRSLELLPEGAVVFFPLVQATLFCGLAGIVAVKRKKKRAAAAVDLAVMAQSVEKIEQRGIVALGENAPNLADEYLGGKKLIAALFESARALKGKDAFAAVYGGEDHQQTIRELSEKLSDVVTGETQRLGSRLGGLNTETADVLLQRLESLKDIGWCLSIEILENIRRIRELMGNNPPQSQAGADRLTVFKNVNAVLNSIDRLEVRGRDSAGISLMFILEPTTFRQFQKSLAAAGLTETLLNRSVKEVLVNGAIHINPPSAGDGDQTVTVIFTYKIAAEIGKLGDNVLFLRQEIRGDKIFQALTGFPYRYHTVSSHTRWASVGAITEANCHPVDNQLIAGCSAGGGVIHVCLNGDIDNYMQLRAQLQAAGKLLHQDITTDTKIIPLQVEKYIEGGASVQEAFRLALNDFEGSHAISMHTDLEPGKLFLAQRGSGQTIFVGIADDHYMPTSEVYGFVEETSSYLKMDGEKSVPGKKGDTQGQIFILDQRSDGGLSGIAATYYDGTPLTLKNTDIKHTEITSRDIDRQGYPHYFLKEISESPNSMERTLNNRWKIKEVDNRREMVVTLNESVVPKKLAAALQRDPLKGGIRRVFFVGQGTAGVAALVCADILEYYLGDPALQIRALKASELSGFILDERDDEKSLADALVIAISQSGTTTDTNRTVDMVRARGAHTLAIVNRRDSDITFKVDGVMYTSSGRDIEMSVASTKAFYSQIIAGALLGLYIAALNQRRDQRFVTEEIQRLLDIPNHMRTVLQMHAQIGRSAQRLATGKTYWATVGSGPNKASAEEIRIKLSELCYKTISADFVEDKKHIDLSSEPLIIVCAAGTRGNVIGDIIKDTAIFKAHKATPVVIADEGEERFGPYAEDVFHVPAVSEHLAPILNTLVGHIWGYYAALSINEGSRFLFNFQEHMQKTIDTYTSDGLDMYEILLEKSFKEKIVRFYKDFREKKSKRQFPAIMGIHAAADLTLLLKYLSGRLPVGDFELDFGVKGTPLNMLNGLFNCLGSCINAMARPVDAIKHQAKTVTVGTSRISEKIEGLLFDTLAAYGFQPAQLTPSNIVVLRNIQEIIDDIKGAIRYRIGNLNLLGEPTEDTSIEVERKDGVLEPIPSRVEVDPQLKGTKKTIVREGNIYLGKGRKDDRSILVIPIISANPETPNFIEYLLLLNVGFKEEVPLKVKIKALGGKLERIKNIVQENSVPWKDEHLEMVAMDELFGRSAEKTGEYIVSKLA